MIKSFTINNHRRLDDKEAQGPKDSREPLATTLQKLNVGGFQLDNKV